MPEAGAHPLIPTPMAQAGGVLEHRELFWQNFIRETLNSLAVAAAQASGRLTPTAKGAANSGKPVSDLFDGRLAVITMQGVRVAIADIYPLFACTINTSPQARALSTDVQCTVFQIRTPEGEVHTLPLQEIRTFHALSPDLIERLKQAAKEQQRHAEPGTQDGEEQVPFGFAAFRALSDTELPQPATSKAPASK